MLRNLLLFITGSVYSFAQPIIQAPNIYADINLSHSATCYKIDESSVNLNNIIGENISWDYSSILATDSLLSTSLAPYDTDVFNTPESHLAIIIDPDKHVNDPDYTFYSLMDDSMLLVKGQEFHDMLFTYSDPQLEMIYPFSYGDNFFDTYNRYFYAGDFFSLHEVGALTAVADGYGSLHLPYGIIEDVLRVKYTYNYEYYEIHDGETLNAKYNTKTVYRWYSNLFGVHPVLTLSYDLDNTSSPTKFYYFKPHNLNIIDQSKNANQVELYPNPSKISSILKFSLAASEEIQIDIYSILGEKIYSQNKGVHQAGIHTIDLDLKSYNPGLYSIKIKIGDHTSNKTLMVN